MSPRSSTSFPEWVRGVGAVFALIAALQARRTCPARRGRRVRASRAPKDIMTAWQLHKAISQRIKRHWENPKMCSGAAGCTASLLYRAPARRAAST